MLDRGNRHQIDRSVSVKLLFHITMSPGVMKPFPGVLAYISFAKQTLNEV